MKMMLRLLCLFALLPALLPAAERAFTVHAWAALAPNAPPNDGYTLMWKGSRNVQPNVAEYRLTVYFGSPSFTYFDENGKWQGIMVGVTDRAYIAGKGFKKPLSEMPKFSPGAWRLVTAVYDNGRVALYLDDKLLAETNGNPPPPENDFPAMVGISESPEGKPCWKMAGKIAFEKYEPRAMSSAEVAALFAREKSLLPELPKPIEFPKTSFATTLPRTAKYLERLKANPPEWRTGNCTARVVRVNGVPRLEVDGKLFSAHAMMPSPYASNAEATQSCRDFAASGVKLFSNIFWTRGGYLPWWKGEGEYDWSLVDARFRAMIAAAPEGRVFPRLKMDPPEWWSKAHPEEMRHDLVNPGSILWRDLRRRMLRDFVTHVENSDYAAYVVGYHVGALFGTEWLTYPPSKEAGPAIADALLDAARQIKGLVGRRKIVGTFFGYDTPTHCDFARVVASPDIDFIAAPYVYDLRRGGEPGASQVYCRASCRKHGKLFFDEADLRTHYARSGDYYRHDTKEESIDAMKRTFGYSLATAQDAWWFLLAGNEIFHDAEFMEVVARGTAELERALRPSAPRGADVAAFHAMGNSSENTRSPVRMFHVDRLPRCGAAYDVYLAEDAEAPDMPKYRSTFLAKDESIGLDEMRERIRRAGCHTYLDSGDVVYAGFGYLCVCASTAGEKTIRLPRASDVDEVFGASARRRSVTEFKEVFRKGETRVYRIAEVEERPFAVHGARWLWPEELGRATNVVVEFCRRFSAGTEVPVKLAIAADTVYRATLNGRMIYCGRFPDTPPQRFYDVIPAGSVRKGENELKVELYVQGIDSFQHIPGDPGLMFALFGEGVSVASDARTMWRRSCRHRSDGVPRVTTQLGFSFEHDAAAKDAPWREAGERGSRRGETDFILSPRPVPRPQILPAIEERIVGQGVLDGSPVPDEPAVGMDATSMVPVPESGFFEEGGRSVRAEHFVTGFYVIVDLGREEAGFLTFDADTDEGVVVDIGHAEHMENGRIRVQIGKRNFAGRYRARDGRQEFCRWQQRIAGRFIQIHVRNVRTRFRLHRLTVRPVELPLAELPPPADLNALQRRIWDVSVRTLRLCMHEHYEDCPWREQALYGNDARNQMLCGYYAFGRDNRMPEHSIALLGRGLGDDGWLEMCMPAKISITIPSFTFCWVLSVDDNLRYRRDLDFTRAMLPTVRSILDRRLSEIREDMLPCPVGSRYWQFYEWSAGMSGGKVGGRLENPGAVCFESPLNLLFVMALEAGARCDETAGDGNRAKAWREAAQRVRAAVRARFWNAEKGQFEMRLGDEVKPSELVQSLALLAGAVPPEERGRVAAKLSARSDWTETTLSQALYKYEALIAFGGEPAKAVLPQMEGDWAAMLDKGATSFWEVREGAKAFRDAGSLCHGWSAVPVYIYGRYPELRSAAR